MSTYNTYTGNTLAIIGSRTHALRVTVPGVYTTGGAFGIASLQMRDGTVGVAYTDTIKVFGGAAPVVLAVTSGALPTGLTLNSSTGVVSGSNPTVAATSTFTITATDAVGATTSQSFAVTISAAGGGGGGGSSYTFVA